MNRSSVLAFILSIGATAILAFAVDIPSAKLRAFAPLPPIAESESNPLTEEKIQLGRMLYFDPRLSRDQKVSCNSCHDLSKYGVDNEATSEGFRGQRGGRNSPTVYNAAAHFVQFWDGREPDVEAQAKGPVMNPVEMAMSSEQKVAEVLRSIPDYVKLFARAFPGEKNPVNLINAARAIGAFERKLMTPSRWDAFLKGDKKALNDEEKTGFLKFVDAGCAACHNGALLGGTSYQKLGAAKAFPNLKDTGVHQVTKHEADKFKFKVPSLRNVTMTGPYFHNGAESSLNTAVRQMSEYQLGKPMTAADVKSIATFLETLTGPLPSEYIKEPQLPASSASTPKPETD